MAISLREFEGKKLTAEEEKEIDEAWGRETERRLAELKSKKVKMIPSKDVHQRIRTQIQQIQQKKS